MGLAYNGGNPQIKAGEETGTLREKAVKVRNNRRGDF